MLKIKYVLSSSLLCVLAGYQSAFAMYPVHDEINRFEIALNGANTLRVYGEEVQSKALLASSYANQLTNMKSLEWNSPTSILDSLNNISDMAQEGKSLTYSTKDLAQRFNDNFVPDKVKNYFTQQQKMSETVLDTSKGTLKSSNAQVEASKQMADTSSQITNNSIKSQGLKEVMQSQVQMQAENTAQLQAVQQSLAQMQSQQATMDAYTVSKQQQEDEATQKFLDVPEPPADDYEGNQQLAIMPHFT